LFFLNEEAQSGFFLQRSQDQGFFQTRKLFSQFGQELIEMGKTIVHWGIFLDRAYCKAGGDSLKNKKRTHQVRHTKKT